MPFARIGTDLRHPCLVLSNARGNGPGGLARLGPHVPGLLYALAIPLPRFCGISPGGLTGHWLAAHYPRRIGKLVRLATIPASHLSHIEAGPQFTHALAQFLVFES